MVHLGTLDYRDYTGIHGNAREPRCKVYIWCTEGITAYLLNHGYRATTVHEGRLSIPPLARHHQHAGPVAVRISYRKLSPSALYSRLSLHFLESESQ